MKEDRKKEIEIGLVVGAVVLGLWLYSKRQAASGNPTVFTVPVPTAPTTSPTQVSVQTLPSTGLSAAGYANGQSFSVTDTGVSDANYQAALDNITAIAHEVYGGVRSNVNPYSNVPYNPNVAVPYLR